MIKEVANHFSEYMTRGSSQLGFIGTIRYIDAANEPSLIIADTFDYSQLPVLPVTNLAQLKVVGR